MTPGRLICFLWRSVAATIHESCRGARVICIPTTVPLANLEQSENMAVAHFPRPLLVDARSAACVGWRPLVFVLGTRRSSVGDPGPPPPDRRPPPSLRTPGRLKMTAVDAVTPPVEVCPGNRFPTANIAKTACEPQTATPACQRLTTTRAFNRQPPISCGR
jgi:hypothetical protein